MASNLEMNVFNYAETLNKKNVVTNNVTVNHNVAVKPKVQKRQAAETIIVKGIKKPLTKLNIFMMVTILALLTIESVIYFHSVQAGVVANRMQIEINKTREESDFLKVELARSKELNKVEKVAINVLSMKSADNGKINYLPLPEIVKDKELYVTNIAPKDREVAVPVGY